MFPFLMLVIVSIQMLSDSARAEQALQAVANRAARTAALCCYRIDAAEAVAMAGLEGATSAAEANRVSCNNDLASTARILFIDAEGNEVPAHPVPPETSAEPVPPGGTAYVFLTCRIPPQVLGGFGFPGLDAERRFVGTATVDPFRSRAEAPSEARSET